MASSNLPVVPGYDGPFSLKAFLKSFFHIDVRYGAPPPLAPPTEAPPRVLYLESASTFAILVYVPKGVRPPPAMLSSVPRRCSDASRAARGSYGTSSHGLAPARVTDAILRHPVFPALLAGVGPAAAAFLTTCCPILVQFEPDGGALQVRGPSLYQTAAGVVDTSACGPKHFHDVCTGRPSSVGRWPSRRAPGRRPRPDANDAAPPVPAAARVRREGAAPSTSPSSSSLALLGRTVVPRRALHEDSVGSVALLAPAVCSTPPRTAPAGYGRVELPAGPLPERWLEGLWVRRHPASRDRRAASVLPPALRRRVRKQLRQRPCSPSAPLQGGAAVADTWSWGENDGTVAVTDEMLRAIFPYTLTSRRCGASDVPLTKVAVDAAAVPCADGQPTDTFLYHHLRAVVTTVMEQCSRLDLRGLALKHTAYLEARAALYVHQRQRQRRCGPGERTGAAGRECPTRDVQLADLHAPVDVVVSYLCDVLRSLRWGGESTAAVGSFWGVDGAAAEAVLAAIGDALRGWLASGPSGQAYPLSAFLTRVPVARVPWLRCLYTTPAPAEPGAGAGSGRPRQRRSLLQQRAFLQLLFFLTQAVMPFCVRRAFHVTGAARGGQELIFVPLPVWWRLVRLHTRQLTAARGGRATDPGCAARETAADSGTSSGVGVAATGSECPSVAPAQLSPVLRARAVWSRAGGSVSRDGWPSAPLTTAGTSGARPARLLLYAALRFLPDGRRLRPIAVVRQGHPARLAAMVRGRCVAARPALAGPCGCEGGGDSHAAARAWLRARLMAGASRTAATTAALLDALRPSIASSPPASPAAPVPLRSCTGAGGRPTAALLRDALACLMHGVREQRRGARPAAAPVPSSLPPLMPNGSHASEYGELRAFVAAVRRAAGDGGEGGGPSRAHPLVLSFVRADAAQCYDRLSQEAVVTAARSLVPHAWYAPLEMTALRPREVRVEVGEGGRSGGDDAAGGARGPAAPLQRHTWRAVVSDADVKARVVPAIPAGWVVEERTVPVGRTVPTPLAGAGVKDRAEVGAQAVPPATDAAAGPTSLSLAQSPLCARPPLEMVGRPGLLSGEVIRRTLEEHLQDHLVAVGDRLFCQRRGIVQGSPVAMLLCESALLAVDATLADILAQHHEPAIQLRRVDDVLVISASPVAGQRCWAAMAAGWPEVGYVSQLSKLLHVTAAFCPTRRDEGSAGVGPPLEPRPSSPPPVPWCGLLLHPRDLTISVEWARVGGTLRATATATAALVAALHRGSPAGLAHCLADASRRLLAVVRLRVPATALCHELNDGPRVLQSLYEACLVWARLVARVLASVADDVWVARSPLRRGAGGGPCCPRRGRRRSGASRCMPARRWGGRGGSAPLHAVSSTALTAILAASLRVCVGCLSRLVQQHRRFLARHGSSCPVTLADLHLSAATALVHTLWRSRPRTRHTVAAPSPPSTDPSDIEEASAGGAGVPCSRPGVLWWRLRHAARGMAVGYLARSVAAAEAGASLGQEPAAAAVVGTLDGGVSLEVGVPSAAVLLWPHGKVGTGCTSLGSLAVAAWRATQTL